MAGIKITKSSWESRSALLAKQPCGTCGAGRLEPCHASGYSRAVQSHSDRRGWCVSFSQIQTTVFTAGVGRQILRLVAVRGFQAGA